MASSKADEILSAVYHQNHPHGAQRNQGENAEAKRLKAEERYLESTYGRNPMTPYPDDREQRKLSLEHAAAVNQQNFRHAYPWGWDINHGDRWHTYNHNVGFVFGTDPKLKVKEDRAKIAAVVHRKKGYPGAKATEKMVDKISKKQGKLVPLDVISNINSFIRGTDPSRGYGKIRGRKCYR